MQNGHCRAYLAMQGRKVQIGLDNLRGQGLAEKTVGGEAISQNRVQGSTIHEQSVDWKLGYSLESWLCKLEADVGRAASPIDEDQFHACLAQLA